MADYLTQACRLQLTTAMEGLIRTAVFEISQIFEDSLHDHQLELARKGEEIAILKVKLQSAELKLKEVSDGGVSDLNLNTSYETPAASEDFAPVDSPAVIEIDDEEPDDWCVPLGNDNINKEESSCPSVRLRQFSIPLLPIPLKHEAFKRLDASKHKLHHIQDSAQAGLKEKTMPKRKPGRPPRSKKNNVKNDLMNITKESFGNPEISLSDASKRTLQHSQDPAQAGLKEESKPKRKPGRPPRSQKQYVQNYLMNITKESFGNPEISLSDASKQTLQHIQDPAQAGSQEEPAPKRKPGRPPRSEKNGVKNYLMNVTKESFQCPEKSLKEREGRETKTHKIRKLRTTKIQRTQASTSGKAASCRFCPQVFDTKFGLSVHEQAHSKSKGCKRDTSKNASTIKEDKSSAQTTSLVKMFTCKCCHKKFESRSHFMQHPCFISCEICHKKLSNKEALLVHMDKMHKDQSWTTPLDENEIIQEKIPFENAKTKIKRCREGYKCMICKKVYLSKYTAQDHTFVHTGERPFKCVFCPKTFPQRNALTLHRKKYHDYVMKKHIKCACSRNFFSSSKYKAHTRICPKAEK